MERNMMHRKIVACFLAAATHGVSISHANAADDPQWSQLPIIERGKVTGRAPMPALSVEKFCHSDLNVCMTIRMTEEVISCHASGRLPPDLPDDGLPVGGPCADFNCEPDPEGSPARWDAGQLPPNGGVLRSGVASRSLRVSEEDWWMGDCAATLLDQRPVPGAGTPGRPAPEYDAFCLDLQNGVAATSVIAKQYSIVSCSSLGVP
jgi:hypothetical protein